MPKQVEVSKGRYSHSQATSTQSSRPLIWAVDPTEKDIDFIKKVAKVAALWAFALDTEVRPVSVISMANMPWLEDATVPLKEILMPAAYRSVNEMIEESRVENFHEPHFLSARADTGSRRAMVQILMKFAKKLKAEMIIAATHGPGGLGRMRLGGFTEKLIAISQTPILAVNPSMDEVKKLEWVLLPTDLTAESKDVFMRVLQLAKKIKAKIKLLHVNDLAYRSLTFAGDWGMSLDPAFIAEALYEEQKERRKMSDSWVLEAESQGVQCKSLFASSTESLSQAILEVERAEDVDVTAMATYAGPIEQVILGSVARDVIHGATKPVLIVRFDADTEADVQVS